MTQSITLEELDLLKDLIFFIYGFTFIMLVISFTMYLIGDSVFKKFTISSIKRPRCHRCDKVCDEQQVGKNNIFFVCTDVDCQEPSE